MSRVEPLHVFLYAPNPEHPLAPSGLEGWTVERTVLRPTGHRLDADLAEWVDRVTFIHYVSPPVKPVHDETCCMNGVGPGSPPHPDCPGKP